jgi:hypothetical protein
MRLTFTHHVDASPTAVEVGLDEAVSAALDAAVELLTETRVKDQTERIESGIRVNGGLPVLDGSEIHVSGTPGLTTIKVAVPWSENDKGGPKLWAANRFATVVADRASLAA